MSIADVADSSRDTLAQLFDAWWQYDPNNEGLVLAEIIPKLYLARRDGLQTDAAEDAMRAALENLGNCPSGKAPTARQIGNKLKQYRGRVLGGQYIDTSD